jgi:hypothetical protein
MSFKNAERVRRWRERQKSLSAMEALATKQDNYARVPTVGLSFADNREKEKEPTFYKMRVTGPRSAEFITTPPAWAMGDTQQSGGRLVRSHTSRPTPDYCGEKQQLHKAKYSGKQCDETIGDHFQAMRELNPSLNAMIQSTEEMKRILCDAARQPPDKRRRIASSVVAMHDAQLHRLKAYMSGSDNAYNPMDAAFALQPPAPHNGHIAPTPQMVEEEDGSSLSSYSAIQKVKADIPKRFHGKIDRLSQHLYDYPNLIRIAPSGRPLVAGKELEHGNIQDIIRSLYVWPRSQPLPSGVKEVIEALRSVHTPSYLLSNSNVRELYYMPVQARWGAEQSHVEGEQEGQEAQREEHRQELEEEEEEEEESSPPFETPMHSALPPLLPVRKAEERVQTKRSPSLLPKPISRTSKASNIPQKPTKREEAKPGTSQSGTGRDHGIREYMCEDPHNPGKLKRVLRMYSDVDGPQPTKKKSNMRNIRRNSINGASANHMAQDQPDDLPPGFPGKKSNMRVLR